MTKGGCLCGAVKFTLNGELGDLYACHCAMCRKTSGGIGLALTANPDTTEWLGSENIQTYTSSDWAERGFCKICGSSLFYRSTETEGPNKGMLSLCAGALDDQSGLTLTTEIYVDHKPQGYAFAGELKQFTQAEVEAQFEQELTAKDAK